jgi:hypothetical protein
VRGAVNDQVEAMRAEESVESGSVADVEVVVSEVFDDVEEAVTVPGCVARLTEEHGSHVVIDTVDVVSLTIKMLHGLGTNEAAGAGNERTRTSQLRRVNPSLSERSKLLFSPTSETFAADLFCPMD